ncbi:MAG: hypothetical protein WAT36_15995 [Chromatiaceae bacterium]
MKVRTLMQKIGVEAIDRKPDLSIRHDAHLIYPHLLGNLAIDRPNPSSATDIIDLLQKNGVKMKVSFFIRIGLIGMLAGTFGYVNAGSGLARLDGVADGDSLAEVLSLAGLAMLPWLLKRMDCLVPSGYPGAE